MIEILDTTGDESYYSGSILHDNWSSKADGAMLVHNLTRPLASGECLAVFRDALLKENGESFPLYEPWCLFARLFLATVNY